ncbi:MAG TPA: glycerate kinase [Ignavibacteriaceae bacterium]|nr:glycerate kinase [Ignavibacteriaceae bacterium]
MEKRILISPNSFKECADSVTIAELIKDNLTGLKDTVLITKPISDGGDGFLNVCKFYFGGEIRNYSITSSYNESQFECPVLYCEKRRELYIESAEVLGLKVVPLVFRNPLELTSKGLGQLLLQIEQGIKRTKIKVEKVYIGIGGTATIDMGMGMMSVLGLKLMDLSGREISVLPENYNTVMDMDYEQIKFSFELIPVNDVTNPLLGEQGGIRIFGNQKNADNKMISILENNFNHLLKLFENNALMVFSNSLSGAGGGIPAALQIFYRTNLLQSSDFIKDNLGLNKYVNNVEYLITGEGAYDHQSGFGKGVKVLMHLFNSNIEQVFLVCGKINAGSIPKLPKFVFPIEISKYFSSEFESITNYNEGIKKACQDIVKQLNF